MNVFVGPERVDEVLTSLPRGVIHGDDDRRRLIDDGQARLRWGHTPIDVFLDTTPFHRDVVGVLATYLGPDDPRMTRLLGLAG